MAAVWVGVGYLKFLIRKTMPPPYLNYSVCALYAEVDVVCYTSAMLSMISPSWFLVCGLKPANPLLLSILN